MTVLRIAEIFGYGEEDHSRKAEGCRKAKRCPFRNDVCNKASLEDPLGICSLTDGEFATSLCPNRFLQNGRIFTDAARIAFGDKARFAAVPEVRILRTQDGRKIGKIDFVLTKVDKDNEPVDFAALEVQAAYFSGRTLRDALAHYLQHGAFDPEDCERRPDYRSCAQKRLVPQLRLKVPVFRRWGREFFVAVDSLFFDELPDFREVKQHNSEITWLSYPIAKHGAGFIMQEPCVHPTVWDDILDALREGEPPSPDEIFEQLADRIEACDILET